MPEPTITTRTQCSYCGVGCGITVHTAGGVIAKVVGDKLHPANSGRLCTKGATHTEMMAAPGRLTSALTRDDDGNLTETRVDDAVARIAAQLAAIIAEYGPDAVSMYVSGQMSVEAQYLATKLAKGFLRTKNLESNSRLCMASAGTGYKQSLGSDGPPGSYADFDHANVFFVSGANMADCHPILFLRMADRLKKGAKLIVVDPRRNATADRADLFLQIKPGTDLALLNGLLHILVRDGRVDERFIAEFTQGWEQMPGFLADYAPDQVSTITGLAVADIETAARWIGEAENWMSCWTMGLNQSTHGTWNTNAICNLHLATGAICRTGSGPLSLTGQPNAMGGREMGYMGPGLPGQRVVMSPEDREFTEGQWGIAPGTIRTDVGTGTIDMFAEMAAGAIKACWVICTNPVASVANRKTVIAGLEAAELVITQDTYRDTATNAYADVVLPATLWAEADAVMVNSERNVTLLQASVRPTGDARPDWRLIADVACAMGFGEHFAYGSSEDVFAELRAFHNPRTGYDLRGISYERLREGPVQWPCSPEAGSRNPIRYLNDGVSQSLHVTEDGTVPRLAFATPSRRAVFWPRPHMPAKEMPDDDYPVVLNTGRLQHQWHTMTKTGKVAKLANLNPDPFVELHPDHARELDINAGDSVEITSRRGRAVLPAVLSDRVLPGNCFAPFHWNDEQGEYLTINAVTNDEVDTESRQPEFKVCAVSLRKVAAPTANPAVDPFAELTQQCPTLTDSERAYLGGFLAGVDASPVVGVPVLPGVAPVSLATRWWIDGLLAGRYSRADDAPPTAVPSAPIASPILVLWSSQTGTAQDVAARCAREISETGEVPQLVEMDSCSVGQLLDARYVLVVTSTFGDGGPPDNGADFWGRLCADGAPRLDGVKFAVLGLGDSAYDDFCGHAKAVNRRLLELGAVALLDRVDTDVDDDDVRVQWLAQVVPAVTGSAPAPPTSSNLTQPTPTSLTPTAIDHAPFTRSAPIEAPLIRNTLLTSGGDKEVRQFGFDLTAHDVAYEVGDALGVFPLNSPVQVRNWLDATGLDGSADVTVGDQEVSLTEAATTHLDITRVTPESLRFIGERNRDPALAKLLRKDNTTELANFLWDKQLVDVLAEFPVRADLHEWQQVLRPLAPRQYSISSSPLVDPAEVHLTVSVLRYDGAGGAPRGGVCSTFLADRAGDQTARIYLHKAPHFRPPADADTPMIMIGPGTGIAPFRAFLHHRRARGDTGKNWLFFGDQHASSNFYYRRELEDMFRDGFLTRLDLAFSRDQRERVYVQHKMIEHGALLWRWLSAGSHLYVCGDAARMARDVDETLLRIAQIHGGHDAESAAAWRKQMVTEKRYVRDIY